MKGGIILGGMHHLDKDDKVKMCLKDGKSMRNVCEICEKYVKPV